MSSELLTLENIPVLTLGERNNLVGRALIDFEKETIVLKCTPEIMNHFQTLGSNLKNFDLGWTFRRAEPVSSIPIVTDNIQLGEE